MAPLTSASRLLVDPRRPPAPASGAIFLVGGYDGSGNYGDMLLLQAALELLEPLAPAVTPIPVIELGFRESHAELAAASPALGAHPVCFIDSGIEPPPAGLRRLQLPPELAFGGVYLYGGGYLNAWWGPRKLEMARAAEAAIRAAGRAPLRPFSSGVQLDVGWAEGLAGRDADLLGALAPLGVRDERSMFNGSLLTGDDAVGVLARHISPNGSAAADSLRINVHLQDADWVTGDGDAHFELVAAMLEALEQAAGARLEIRPVVAYDDRRLSERPLVERLAAHGRIGSRVAGAPLVLRPGDLEASLGVLADAALTVSSSYHVALTSDLLGVPAVLMAGTPYYEQKAAGLAADFGLPPAFTVRAQARPDEAAAAIAAALLRPDELRAALRQGTQLSIARRREAERELVDQLSARTRAASSGEEAAGPEVAELLADHAELIATRDRLDAEVAWRDAELADRGDRLDRVWGELETHKAERTSLLARIAELEAVLAREREAAAALQEAHATVVGSRSWRLTGLLRRGAERLRSLRP